MQANEKQIGGNHYRAKSIQPWDVVNAAETPDVVHARQGSSLWPYCLWPNCSCHGPGGEECQRPYIHPLAQTVGADTLTERKDEPETPDVLRAGDVMGVGSCGELIGGTTRCTWPQCACQHGADTRGSMDGEPQGWPDLVRRGVPGDGGKAEREVP